MSIRAAVWCLAAVIATASPGYAQAPGSPFRIDTTRYVLQRTPSVAAQLHPAAKGALIGAAVGAGTMGAIGLWYCTIGPSETGDCTKDHWFRAIPLYVGIGAGVGALIGALK